MNSKLKTLLVYLAQRSSEPSTWRGVVFLLTLAGSKYAALNWGEAACIGSTVSAMMKILFPDVKLPPKEES